MKITFVCHMKNCVNYDPEDPVHCEYVAPEIYMHSEGNLRCRDFEVNEEPEGV